WPDCRRLAHHGKQPSSEVLQSYDARSRRPEARDARLAAPSRRDCPHSPGRERNVRTFLSRLRSTLDRLQHRDADERDLDQELRAYLEAAVDANVATGMSREAAELAARRQIGSVETVKEWTRDVGWETHLRAVWDDLAFAWKRLSRNRWLTL